MPQVGLRHAGTKCAIRFSLRIVRATANSTVQNHFQPSATRSLIGTPRRECLDQMVICGKAHLRRILSTYAAYYNQARTHLALQRDALLR